MSFFYNEQEMEPKVGNIVLSIGVVIVVGWLVLAFVGPIYNVWQQGLAGEAELKRAEQNRQITVLEAQAANEAATQNAEASIKIATAQASAEIERAKGVAEANSIIGDSLKGNEDYLRYLYINGIANKGSQIIYVPTEAGLPILEAGKR